MGKQKKNSNYQTENAIAKQTEKEEQKLKEKRVKTIKTVAISVAAALAVIAAIVGILFAVGVFDYSPKPTYHATLTVEDYGSLHIELYGNDAPETVENFIKLAEGGFFDDMPIHTFADGLLYGGSYNSGVGSHGIKGEFASNGFENKIPMSKGVICMSRGEEYDSGYGQFFILTENNKDLEGEYAAFGKLTDLDTLNDILKNIKVGEDGKIDLDSAPRILSVSLHEAHH